MRKYVLLMSAIALGLLLPRGIEGQVAVELHGEFGRTAVDVNKWLGIGIYKPQRNNMEGDVAVVVGRRGPRRVQVVGELGYQHLITYRQIIAGQPVNKSINSARLFGIARFWMSDATWFLEAGIGTYPDAGQLDDLAFVGSIGDLYGLTDRLSIPVRVRGVIMFDQRTMVLPLSISAGLAYRFGG